MNPVEAARPVAQRAQTRTRTLLLRSMAKYGKKANPGADDSTRIEVLAYWHWVQSSPRLAQMRNRVHWTFFCLDRRRNRVTFRCHQLERGLPRLASRH
jgi:hypothetical protein